MPFTGQVGEEFSVEMTACAKRLFSWVLFAEKPSIEGKWKLSKDLVPTAACLLRESTTHMGKALRECPFFFIMYLNYTSRKVMLINSLMYEGNIQISEYEGTYLTLI